MMLPPTRCIQCMTTTMAFTSQLGGVVDAHVDSTLGKHSHAAPVSEQTICMLRKRWHELCLLHDTIPESA